MPVKKVICNSGLTGWQDNLQNTYDNFEEFEYFAETYGLHNRLGYSTPIEAWEDNPMIEGSLEPSDYRKSS